MSSSEAEHQARAQAKKFEARKLTDGVYQLFPDPKQATQDADVEILLFPGLQLSGLNPEHAHWRTWKMRASEECWLETLLPELLKDSQYRARVLSVSYEGRVDLPEGTQSSDDYLIVETLIRKLIFLRKVALGQKSGVPVILLGHDLGGTLIKQFVMGVEKAVWNANEERSKKLRSFLENLKSVFFYAAPQSGAPFLDQLARTLPPDTSNKMLRFMKVLNASASRLNQEFQSFRKGSQDRRLSEFKTYAIHPTRKTKLYLEGKLCGSFEVVPEGSARADVDEFVTAFEADHFEVCQAKDECTTHVQMLVEEINSSVEDEKRRKGVPPEEMREIRLKRFDGTGAKSDVEVLCTSSTQASAPTRSRT